MGNKLIIPLVCIVVFGLGLYCNAEEFRKNTIHVNGKGEITSEPDVSYINLTVETSSKIASEAVKINAEKSENVINQIKKIISGKDKIKTTSYRLYPVYEYNNSTKKQYLKEYRAVNEVLVETYNLKIIGKLIDSTSTLGVNRINGPRFGISNSDDIKKQALALAVKDAKMTADVVASTSGTKIIKILKISPSYHSPQPYHNRNYQTEAISAKAVSTPIEPGDLTITANVNIVYEIE